MRPLRRDAYAPEAARAIRLAGGPRALAARLRVVPSAVTQWVRVPVRHARAVAQITGLALYEIRPDVWQKDEMVREGSMDTT
jgi:DNA-binding transcriptional regulator YdaS (Cro superfamily)